MLIIVAAFCTGFALDFFWAWYVGAIQSKKPLLAANLSALLYLCSAVSTILIVAKCIPAVSAYIVGGWIGTYVVVKWSK